MRIRVYATLRDLMDGAIHDMPVSHDATVGSVLERLIERHPALGEKLWDADGRLTGYVTILLNGRSVAYLDGLQSSVDDTDTLALFPPVGGG